MAARRWIGAFAGVACLVLLASAHVGAAHDDGELRRHIRAAGLLPYWSFRPPARFSYPDIAGGPDITLEAFRGRVLLVNLWATWCSACGKEMASLQALRDRFHQRGLEVVGINILDRTSPAAMAGWLRERGVTYPNARAADDGPKFPSRHDVPQTFLIDRRGRLLANKSGEWDWMSERVTALIVHVLNGP